MLYVKIPYINGRLNWALLSHEFESKGYGNVEYCEGGWMDNTANIVDSHLRFENDEDAIAFALQYGKKVYNRTPYTDE